MERRAPEKRPLYVIRGGICTAPQISHHRTQKEAADAARQIAQNQKSEVLIHGRDNLIRERDSYGNDPHPPKG